MALLKHHALVRTKWHVECIRQGDKVWEVNADNVVTMEAIDKLLMTMFKEDTQISNWHVVLSESGTASQANTYVSKGFTECTAYTSLTRPAWAMGSAASGQMSNSGTKATFTISDTKTIYGAALVGGGTAGSVKNDTAGGGILYGYANFPDSKDVVATDVLNVTVTASAT